MLVPAVYPRAVVVRRLPRLLVPSLSDCLFLAILLWGFAAGSGWSALLADGDTGWHIRTGEYILSTRAVPTQDLFSFSKADQPWFAWEWLSDITFAGLHRFSGLKGVVVFAGLVLSLAATMLFRYAVWRGANVVAALLATLLATGASTVHYLARPHIFTILGLTVTVWMIERDRRCPTRAVWFLVPLTAACGAATFANPYGWRLHEHLARYLTSGWIREVVEEFQSPRFRSESMLQFEILLLGGVLLVPLLFRQRRIGDPLMMFLMAATLLTALKRFSLRIDSNLPLTYYGLLVAYWHGNAYTLDNYWVLGGLLYGLRLRFEFLGGAIEKLIPALEQAVFVYVAVRCVKLVLLL